MLNWVDGLVSAGICNYLAWPVFPVKSFLAFHCASESVLNSVFIRLTDLRGLVVCSYETLFRRFTSVPVPALALGDMMFSVCLYFIAVL